MAQYTGKPRHQVPAPIYDLFISAFEKKVTEHQKLIEGYRKMERLYGITVEWLKKACIREEHQVDFDDDTVTVCVQLNAESHLDSFHETVAPLGTRLKELGLHDDGKPAVGDDVFYLTQRTFRWRIGEDGDRTIVVTLVIPTKTGTADYEVITSIRSYQSETHTLVKRQNLIEAVDIYSAIARDTGFTRDQVKEMCHMLAYSADLDAVIVQQGLSMNAETMLRVSAVRDALARHVRDSLDIKTVN